MTIRALIGGSDLDQLDSELIIGHILGRPRSWLLAHDDESLSAEQLRQWNALSMRRRRHEPVAYITGEKEFFGRSFQVTPDVLIPRPATEGLVELTLEFLQKPQAFTVTLDEGISAIGRTVHVGPCDELIDAGTGSGCIGITIALERPQMTVHAIDHSKNALAIAIRNAALLHAGKRLHLVHDDAVRFVTAHDRPFILVSNPPYIPAHTPLPPSVRGFEPHVALFAGTDGLQLIRPLLSAASNNAHCKGIIMEMRSDQVREADRILESAGRVVS